MFNVPPELEQLHGQPVRIFAVERGSDEPIVETGVVCVVPELFWEGEGDEYDTVPVPDP